MSLSAFVAYPSRPAEIGQAIQRVAERLRGTPGRLVLTTWEQNDIAGRPLTAPIFEGISQKDLMIADVTTLNFNVTYEIGYAIGTKKRAYLISHSGINGSHEQVKRVGIFDTLGFESYRDSDDLFRKLSYPIDTSPILLGVDLNSSAPLYLLETPFRTEALGRIITRIKKARIHYRSFVPAENVRLAAMEAINNVASSFGVVVPLLGEAIRDSDIHNIRAAFIAGLAHGMQKPTLILQFSDSPVPLDVRDFVKFCQHPRDIDEHVEDLAASIFEGLQSREQTERPATGLLAALSIGDPMAENEFQTLGDYFVETDQYQRTLRGEVNLVVGRKGTGKTALFSQVRDRIRRDRQNIVVDLKPEGYQLQKLKEDVYGYLAQGAKEHLLVAFWEYLLYREVSYKILEKDHDRHLRDHRLTEPYRNLSSIYAGESGQPTGDFSERLQELSSRIALQYLQLHGRHDGTQLNTDDVTGLIHRNELENLRSKLSAYLTFKKGVWILFDNLDRGWSPQGLTADDILVVRTLIDAGRKIQREMQRLEHDFHCVIFLRNDVYDLLMRRTADFGKEMRTSLDWTDPDAFRELMNSRIAANDNIPQDRAFDRLWNEICVPLVHGTESFHYLVERSLMRPRNLLKLVIHCKGSAVNLHHDKIEAEDIQKGVGLYSTDLLIEIDQELAQIDPGTSGLIYVFENERPECTREDIDVFFDLRNIPRDRHEQVIELLMYYGFFGVKVASNDPKYIHDVNYDMRMLTTMLAKHEAAVRFVINPAFWPALSITETS